MMFHDTIKHDFCNLTAFPLVLDKTEMLGGLCQGRIAIIYTFCPLLRILGRLCDIVEDEVLKVLLHPMSILKSVDHRQKEVIGVWQNVLPVRIEVYETVVNQYVKSPKFFCHNQDCNKIYMVVLINDYLSI